LFHRRRNKRRILQGGFLYPFASERANTFCTDERRGNAELHHPIHAIDPAGIEMQVGMLTVGPTVGLT
jgi:hypothetical protein